MEINVLTLKRVNTFACGNIYFTVLMASHLLVIDCFFGNTLKDNT